MYHGSKHTLGLGLLRVSWIGFHGGGMFQLRGCTLAGAHVGGVWECKGVNLGFGSAREC